MRSTIDVLFMGRKDMCRNVEEDEDILEDIEECAVLTTDKVWKALDSAPVDPGVRKVITDSYEVLFTHRIACLQAGGYANADELLCMCREALVTGGSGRPSLEKPGCKEGIN
jgi:hypothetical protein